MRELTAAAIVARRLAGNALRYRYLRLLGGAGRPQALSLELTHDCVCRCLMCNIWKLPADVPNLPLTDWTALLSSDLLTDLRELDLTGGEPFLRDDLVSLIHAVCALKPTHLTRLRSVAITTNGVLTDRVVAAVAQMLPPMSQAGLDLVVVCALDAIGELHDRIRRHPGAWKQVDETITRLNWLRNEHRNLILGVKTTVLPLNVTEVEGIERYARERGLFTIISPAIVTSGRYLNAERAGDLTLEPAARARLAQFYEGPDFRWSYHAKTVARFLRTDRIRKPCSCGYNYFFVRSNGEVFLCPLLSQSAGNLRTQDIREIFRSREARAIRKRVGRAAECARCTEPGLERYSLPYEGFAYLRILLRQGPHSFLDLHRHLGLDKYVNC